MGGVNEICRAYRVDEGCYGVVVGFSGLWWGDCGW